MLDIRNFSIIAHIDHGKSTLSDCLIQFCGGLQQRDMRFRVLDSMDLERERGITIKAQCVTLSYTALNGLIYRMNFIDTPGHVDFSYEVSRSLFACEGVLLLVDSTQGVQAQTLANARMALEMNLVIVLVLNKIDLFTSDIKGVCRQVEDLIGIDTTNVVLCSAKNGTGISNILENLVKYIPSPTGNPSASLQALIIDAWFDNYCGVVFLVCIKNGILRKGDKVKFMSTDRSYFIDKLGVFTPKSVERKVLYCGEVGWFVCVIKDVFSSLVGDTLTSYLNSSVNVLPSFKRITPKVYSSFFITDSSLQNNFRLAIHKLSLNDSSFSYEPENSPTFGFGFRCGFLGTLHMEVVQARLEREYSLTLIRTTPTVVYEVLTSKGDVMYLNSAEKFLSKCCIKEIREPIVKCNIFLQQEHIGDVISLCVSRRGKNVKIISYSEQIILTCYLPMAEVMLGFFNHVKSITHGYGSLDYSFKEFQVSDLICLEILINGKRIDALAAITHRNHINHRCKEYLSVLHKMIPRQQFDIVIQAAIGKRIISRLVIKQLRKDVISKCYGGDVTRKKKLILKQKAGKKRMKNIGNVRLPVEVFMTNINMMQYSK